MKIEYVRFDDLTDEEKEVQPNNGSGKEYANYLKVTNNGETILLKSDAMEPEDCTFSRDLNWIAAALKTCYGLDK